MLQYPVSSGWRLLETRPPRGLLRRIESYLRDREPYCVAAAARFLQRDGRDRIWWWESRSAGQRWVSALLILSKGTLFPILPEASPAESGFFRDFPVQPSTPLYAIQGLSQDVSLVESLFAAQGLSDFLHLDYDLMALDAEAVELAPPFPNLRLRYAEARDLAELLPLQAAYEREEVIPEGGGFDPARCLLSLEHIMRRERLLLAQGPSQIIGKINTNAASFSRYQIGGVYVRPEYRARGIASFMAAAFTRDLRRLGRGLTLFVKQCNPAAQAVYRRIGFQIIAAYRISYPRHLPWRRIGRAKG